MTFGRLSDFEKCIDTFELCDNIHEQEYIYSITRVHLKDFKLKLNAIKKDNEKIRNNKRN
jgi:septation ring formation regulator EzrA